MPKKKSSRPAASLGSDNNPEPKSPTQLRREKVIRIGAIVIVLALLMSLLAGAFSITPSQAAEPRELAKSVQIHQADDTPTGTAIDTDGDGQNNNVDSDVDGDGIVNGKDSDIDGDGVENFDDADPIDTTNIDSNSPDKPDRPVGTGDISEQPETWFIAIPAVALSLGISAWILAKRRKKSH